MKLPAHLLDQHQELARSQNSNPSQGSGIGCMDALSLNEAYLAVFGLDASSMSRQS
jgi:hypothetical protein